MSLLLRLLRKVSVALRTSASISSTFTARATSLLSTSYIARALPYLAEPFISPYDSLALSDGPVLYLPLSSPTGTEQDLGTGAHTATYPVQPLPTVLPNGDLAKAFNGLTQYAEVVSAVDLSVTNTGVLCVECWMRPDVYEFPVEQSTGYVHFAGKGITNKHEWACRMYGLTTTDVPPRPQRISGYDFNASGGLGNGAYFQDSEPIGQWIHYFLVINSINTSGTWPTGYVAIYKNGVLRQTFSIGAIVSTYNNAPVRIGTRDFGSWFQGAIGKFAVYSYELTQPQIAAHTAAMLAGPSLNIASATIAISPAAPLIVSQPTAITVTFTRHDTGALYDPSVPILELRHPGRDVATLTLVRQSLGIYASSVTVDRVGEWYFRARSGVLGEVTPYVLPVAAISDGF